MVSIYSLNPSRDLYSKLRACTFHPMAVQFWFLHSPAVEEALSRHRRRMRNTLCYLVPGLTLLAGFAPSLSRPPSISLILLLLLLSLLDVDFVARELI